MAYTLRDGVRSLDELMAPPVPVRGGLAWMAGPGYTLRALARRMLWRAWIEPDVAGWRVMRPGHRATLVTVASCQSLTAAVVVCEHEIRVCRDRELGGRW